MSLPHTPPPAGTGGEGPPAPAVAPPPPAPAPAQRFVGAMDAAAAAASEAAAWQLVQRMDREEREKQAQEVLASFKRSVKQLDASPPAASPSPSPSSPSSSVGDVRLNFHDWFSIWCSERGQHAQHFARAEMADAWDLMLEPDEAEMQVQPQGQGRHMPHENSPAGFKMARWMSLRPSPVAVAQPPKPNVAGGRTTHARMAYRIIDGLAMSTEYNRLLEQLGGEESPRGSPCMERKESDEVQQSQPKVAPALAPAVGGLQVSSPSAPASAPAPIPAPAPTSILAAAMPQKPSSGAIRGPLGHLVDSLRSLQPSHLVAAAAPAPKAAPTSSVFAPLSDPSPVGTDRLVEQETAHHQQVLQRLSHFAVTEDARAALLSLEMALQAQVARNAAQRRQLYDMQVRLAQALAGATVPEGAAGVGVELHPSHRPVLTFVPHPDSALAAQTVDLEARTRELEESRAAQARLQEELEVMRRAALQHTTQVQELQRELQEQRQRYTDLHRARVGRMVQETSPAPAASVSAIGSDRNSVTCSPVLVAGASLPVAAPASSRAIVAGDSKEAEEPDDVEEPAELEELDSWDAVGKDEWEEQAASPEQQASLASSADKKHHGAASVMHAAKSFIVKHARDLTSSPSRSAAPQPSSASSAAASPAPSPDLRSLSWEALGAMLRDYGIPEDEIANMSRWSRVTVVQQYKASEESARAEAKAKEEKEQEEARSVGASASSSVLPPPPLTLTDPAVQALLASLRSLSCMSDAGSSLVHMLADLRIEAALHPEQAGVRAAVEALRRDPSWGQRALSLLATEGAMYEPEESRYLPILVDGDEQTARRAPDAEARALRAVLLSLLESVSPKLLQSSALVASVCEVAPRLLSRATAGSVLPAAPAASSAGLGVAASAAGPWGCGCSNASGCHHHMIRTAPPSASMLLFESQHVASALADLQRIGVVASPIARMYHACTSSRTEQQGSSATNAAD